MTVTDVPAVIQCAKKIFVFCTVYGNTILAVSEDDADAYQPLNTYPDFSGCGSASIVSPSMYDCVESSFVLSVSRYDTVTDGALYTVQYACLLPSEDFARIVALPELFPVTTAEPLSPGTTDTASGLLDDHVTALSDASDGSNESCRVSELPVAMRTVADGSEMAVRDTSEAFDDRVSIVHPSAPRRRPIIPADVSISCFKLFI